MTPTRRLAAILAAEVAGYSRLMGADEVGTLEALKAVRRKIRDSMIAARNGRMVTTGDATLVEFASAGAPVTWIVDFRRAAGARARFARLVLERATQQ